MNAYPMDLRSKVLDAVERGIPLREVAEFLGISLSTIPRYVKLRASGTEIAPKPSPRAGRRSSPRARSTGTSFAASWKRATPEMLESLEPGERRTVYSVLGLRVDALPGKSSRVCGVFGEENLSGQS